MNRAIHSRLLIVVAVSIALGSAGCRDEVAWPAVTRAIEAEYPDVRRISTDSLAAWLASESETPPILLDVRTEDEFAVSHLRGARRIEPGADDFSMLDVVDPDTPIVAYCSIGFRSAELADRLQNAGFTNVYNLDGSIFRWANESRPVYREGREVREVHPYDALWGRLLDRRLRAEAPHD